MLKSTKKKNKKLLFLTILTIGILFASAIPTILMNFNPAFSGGNENNREEHDLFTEIQSSQIDSYENIGDNMSLELQQSIYNTSTIAFSNLSESGSFSQPAPRFEGYNTTFANITVENIKAPNREIVVETGTSNSEPIDTYDWAFSFEVPFDCVLDNFSMVFTENHPFSRNATIYIYLYSAIWDSDEQSMIPNSWISDIEPSYQIDDGSTAVQYNITNIEETLDLDDTDNNTYFIRISQNTASDLASVRFHYENDGTTDNSIASKYWGGATGWSVSAYDPSMNINLRPLNNTPRPEQINLTINDNGFVKFNDIDNKGYWNTTEGILSDLSGTLGFEITAGWWDVSCDITNIQINYTKNDLNATASFSIPTVGSNVEWNVSAGDLTYFDPRITHTQTINFTIPSDWDENSIKVFNDTSEKTSLVKRDLGNTFREVMVINGGNGTNWYLTANSTNLMNYIKTEVSNVDIAIMNHSDSINFLVNFSESIEKGDVNLYVYSPISAGQYENYSNTADASATFGSEIDLGSWAINSSVTDYGLFLIQATWDNGTAAGFFEKNITIIGETELLVQNPQRTEFDSGGVFDLQVLFNDTGQDLDIDNANISYKINNNDIGMDQDVEKLGNGLYNVSIDCNGTYINYGLNAIWVNASKEYYNYATTTFEFNVTAETELIIEYPPQSTFYESDESFDIQVFYNDTIKNMGIEGAEIFYSLDGGETYYDNDTPLTGGYYNITVDCNNVEFDNYGSISLIINASRANYHPQSETLNIDITGQSSLIINDPTVGASFDSDQTFNITVTCQDTARTQALTGATLYVLIDGNYHDYESYHDYGDGTYQITIDANHTNFSNYGTFEFNITAEKDYYYNASDVIDIDIIGTTSLSVESPAPNQEYMSGDIFNITVQFNDTSKLRGISNADITYDLGSGSRTDNWKDIGNGKYNITIICNDTEIDYGQNSITINASKTNYHWAIASLNFTVISETDLIIESPNPLITHNFDSNEYFDIGIFFNDTIKNQGIENAEIKYSINGNNFRSDNIENLTGGYFNITIFCNDLELGNNYGDSTILINASLQYYESDEEILNINVRGTTELTIVEPSESASFYSDQFFNFTVTFNDTSRNTLLSGANVYVYINDSLHIPFDKFDWKNGSYEIMIDANHTDFSNYGTFEFKITAEMDYYYNASDTLNILITGRTSLSVLSPEENSIYKTGESFNITVIFEDTSKLIGIPNALIEYDLGEGYKSNNTEYIGEGRYNITIFVVDPDFSTNYGFITIPIRVSRPNYESDSTTFTFHRQITTTISPGIYQNLGSVIRGHNISYTFNYSDTQNNPVLNVNWSGIEIPEGLEFYLFNEGSGSYSMQLDTGEMDVKNEDYTFLFNVSAIGYEFKEIRVNFTVLIAQTMFSNTNFSHPLSIDLGENQSLNFYFNDTDNNEGVKGLITSDIIVYNRSSGLEWNVGFKWSLFEVGGGYYELNISVSGLKIGWYYLKINASNFPNYNWTTYDFDFYLIGNETQINLHYFSDAGGLLQQEEPNNYKCFIDSDLFIEFNITFVNYEEFATVDIGSAANISIGYLNILNPSIFGYLTDHPTQPITGSGIYTGYIRTSDLSVGFYSMNLTIESDTYEIEPIFFNLTVRSKYQVNISILSQPTEVTAGNEVSITLKLQFNNGTEWISLSNKQIAITPYFDGTASNIFYKISDANGETIFTVTPGTNVKNMSIQIQLPGTYNYTTANLNISNIKINPAFSIEDILPYIIIGIIGLAAVAISVMAYRKVIVPKKRAKQKVLTEVKTMFEDAVNLEHILVLYKGSGTCIFFRSFGSEKIDPDLISGFISAVSSFGREVESQKALNEINYGDKMLLLADGEYIRVALVLSKSASLILREHLKNFIKDFEEKYTNALHKWRGQLTAFKDAGHLVDENFHTSIILPHKLEYELSDVKKLKKSQSRGILALAQDVKQEAEREFFFISTVLDKAIKETKMGVAEIFIGIKELRDDDLLIPIDISTLEKKPITPQERSSIERRLREIPDISDIDRQKIIQELGEMNPEEREAYIVSLKERAEIISAPVESRVGEKVIEDEKQAKQEIKTILKKAKKERGVHSYEKAIELYKDAGIIANNWDMNKILDEIQDFIRITQIDQYRLEMMGFEKDAQKAAKAEDFDRASKLYKRASRLASEIFKLGVNEMQDTVKDLTKKSKEYEKLIE